MCEAILFGCAVPEEAPVSRRAETARDLNKPSAAD